MAFEPLKNRIGNLPLVICGPMVRKTDEDSVSVWIACKEEVKNLKLEIYEVNNNDVQDNTPVFSGFSSTKALGEFLHLAVITATSENSTTKLKWGTIYGYNIIFDSSKTLENDGILNDGISSICYKPFKLPTICLPASKLEHLKITHGSCRLPHAGRTDALRGLDTMLDVRANDPHNRPQMLFLTGDQIYADDVADSLLYMLIDAGKTLLNWKDRNGLDIEELLPIKVNSAQLFPGMRKEIVAENPDKISRNNLSTQDSKNHLIFLSEFSMMYLFVWSEVLWPLNDLPSYKESKLWKFLDEHGIGAGMKKKIENQNKGLKTFKNTLKYVRKALANISTYMIFDDHEITDDWFLNRKWTEFGLEKNTLNQRIISNGLVAYALFQDWGNTPKDYHKDDKKKLLELINTLGSNSLQFNISSVEALWEDLTKLVMPKLIDVVALQGQVGRLAGGKRLDGGLKWNYHFTIPCANIIFLNTRTNRGYSSKKGDAALISTHKMKGQLVTNHNKSFNIVISPAPFIGNIKLEDSQKNTRDGFSIARKAKGSNSGMYANDQEAWSFNRPAFYEFMQLLIKKSQKVLVLSGDVHYGFSVSAKLYEYPRKISQLFFAVGLPNSKNESIHEGTIVNLTASSFKNHLGGPHKVAYDQMWQLQPKLEEETMVMDEKKAKKNHEVYFYHKDKRKATDRNNLLPLSETTGTLQKKAGKIHPRLMSSHRAFVGKENIGLVAFEGDKIPVKIIHQLWFAYGKEKESTSAEDKYIIFPHTQHDIDI